MLCENHLLIMYCVYEPDQSVGLTCFLGARIWKGKSAISIWGKSCADKRLPHVKALGGRCEAHVGYWWKIMLAPKLSIKPSYGPCHCKNSVEIAAKLWKKIFDPGFPKPSVLWGQVRSGL